MILTLNIIQILTAADLILNILHAFYQFLSFQCRVNIIICTIQMRLLRLRQLSKFTQQGRVRDRIQIQI